MKLIILGYGRHGKDTFADMLAGHAGVRASNSSWFACERVMYPKLASYYNSIEMCYADRHSRRAEWYDGITEYNTPNKARLARELFQENDIYVGMRNADELAECRRQGLLDLVIWVDASHRHPPEDVSSCTVGPEMADIIVTNNGPLDDLDTKAARLAGVIYGFGRMWNKRMDEIGAERGTWDDLKNLSDDNNASPR